MVNLAGARACNGVEQRTVTGKCMTASSRDIHILISQVDDAGVRARYGVPFRQRSQPSRSASRERTLPSSVFGPVLMPPWNLHLFPRNNNLHWQGRPRLLIAPQVFPSIRFFLVSGRPAIYLPCRFISGEQKQPQTQIPFDSCLSTLIRIALFI